MAEKVLHALIQSRFDGKGTSDAQKSFKSLSEMTGQGALQQQMMAERSGILKAKLSELSREVLSGSKSVDQATREYAKFSNQTTFTTTSLKSMVSQAAIAIGTITALGFAAKRGFDFARAGAEVDFAEKRFERLSKTIGTTADTLEQDLKIATRGMIDNATLMASAADLMGLGLAKNHDEAVRLTRVAAALNMNMNQLVLTLTNQTTMRFDALGVAVDGFEDKVKKLEKAGYDTNEAFKLAFLAQAEEQIEKVGERADETAGSFDRLTVSLENLKTEIQRDAAGPVARLADQISARIALNRALEEGAIDAGEFGDAIMELDLAALGLNKTGRTAIEIFDEYNTRLAEMEVKAKEAAQAQIGLAKALFGDLGFEVEVSPEQAYMQLIEQGGQAGKESGEEYAKAFKAAMDDLSLAIQDPLGKLNDQFEEQQAGLVEKAARIRDAIADLEGKPLTERGRAELREMQRELDNTKVAILANAEAHEYETRVALFGILQQKIARMELTDDQMRAAETMINTIAHAWGIVGDQTFQQLGAMDRALGLFAEGNVKAAQQEILNIGRAALAVEGDYFITFHIQAIQEQFNIPGGGGPRGRARGGATATSIDNLIESQFPSGTFSGLKGTGGLVGKPPKAKKEAKEEKKSPIQQALELANAYSSIGSIAAERLRDQVIDPLQEQIEGIDKLLSLSHIDLSARERSVELEAQRAEAAKKVADAEKQILEFQRAQQSLRFLETQVQLLELIEENKLDSQEILGGLELGIDADMGQVLEAMTRALDELIAKTEEKLGIASESKVYKAIGKNLDLGLVAGIEENIPKVDMAVSKVFSAVVPTGDMLRRPGAAGATEDGTGGSPIIINVGADVLTDRSRMHELARELAQKVKEELRKR